MKELNILFQNIKDIKNKYNKLNSEKAYDFNIFTLILKSGDEVNLHNKFIYELLNPKGSHSQGRLFLDLFLKELFFEPIIENIEAFREKHYIDILLQANTNAIIIENKIFTQDHSSQLSRYLKKVKSLGYKKSNINLVYLTLFGRDPLEKKVKDKVISISYREEITSWLEKCIEEVKHIAPLHEILIQYLYLVESLTNQSKEKGLIMETKKLLLKENNLKNILAIEPSIIEAKIEIQFNFWQTLLSDLFPYYAFSFYNANNHIGLRGSIRRYYELQKNNKDYGIKYKIDKNVSFFIELRKNIYYGFEFSGEESIIQEKRKILDDNIDISWNEISNNIYWKYSNKHLNFKDFNHQNIFDLIDLKQQKKDITKISKEVIYLISQYEKSTLCLENQY